MLPKIEPAIRLYQYAVMPDHLHMLLSVERDIDAPLGAAIARMKAWVNHSAQLTGVFDEGYNDQILRHDRNLNQIYQYIRDNPRRLAMRLTVPGYFRRVTGVVIDGRECRLYGNPDLLYNSFKEQVIVHRADSPQQFAANLERCVYIAANGGVLVSPFISPREREIREAALAAGGRLIKLLPLPFSDRQKPAAADFRLCEEGRLLTVSPLTLPGAPAPGAPVTRAAAISLKALAAAIAATPFPPPK